MRPRIFVLASMLIGLVLAYRARIRPWQLRWGATDAEIELFSPAILFNLLIEFFDIVMMRKCMLGIKRRAEAR